MKCILRVFSIFLFVATAHAQQLPASTKPIKSPVPAQGSAKTAPKLDAIATIPVSKLQAVEKNGEIFFLSENGRFVVRGQITDVWAKKPLTTMNEIKYAASHVDVDVMGLPLDEMNTITIPGGKKRLIVFVDPQCSYCKAFLKDVDRHKDKYTFKIVVVPALGDKSNELSKSLFCAADKSNAFSFLMQDKLGTMPQKPNCDTKYYDLTLTMAQLFGVQQIPFFIAPDGRFKPGTGPAFWQWVEGQG